MIVYKIVLKKSKSSTIARGCAEVVYKPHHFVEAPQLFRQQGYHLVVFRDLRSALNYNDSIIDGVWVARAHGIRPPLPFCNVAWLSRGYMITGEGLWPPGTLFAKQVKLLSPVGR